MGTQNQKLAQVRELKIKHELTQVYQQKLSRRWDSRISDSLAFMPHELRGLSLEEAKVGTENNNLGTFASNYLKNILLKRTSKDVMDRMAEVKKLVAVGFGRGYDCEWLTEAVDAGFQTWWLDVSKTAIQKAKDNLEEQYKSIERPVNVFELKPVVKQCEIQSVLANPESIGIDLTDVEIWYLCRLITCLSKNSARVVLKLLGQKSFSEKVDVAGVHKAVIIGAMRDYNPSRAGKTSNLYTMKELLSGLQNGAKRPLEIVGEASHMYFNQNYSAFTIQAKI